LPLAERLALLLIVCSVVAVALALHLNSRAVDGRIESALRVEEPKNAAAHELEINVLGTGLGVWKYLSTGAPEHRARVEKDKADYRRFRASYAELATTEAERDLGARLDALYEPYAALCSTLMETRDAFVQRLRGATACFWSIDRILDDSLQPGLAAQGPGNGAKMIESLQIEADAAECLAALGTYLADPSAANRKATVAMMAELEQQVDALEALELDASERAHLYDLRRFLDVGKDEVSRAIALHESLQRDRRSFIALRGRLDELLDESIQASARESLEAARGSSKDAVRRLYVGSMLVLAIGAFVCVSAAVLLAYRSVQLESANRELRAEFARREAAEAARTKLLHQMVTVQETERGRLARELHDQLGQDLAALLLDLKRLETAEPDVPQTAATRARLSQLQELTRRLMEQMHAIAWELRPAALDDLGVHGALSAYLEQWTRRSGTAVDFESNLEGQRLPSAVELALYRIAQEALTNVLKHASARSVSLTLRRDGAEVVMVVEDDGAGFAPNRVLAATRTSGRLGLLGMHERAAATGGALELESSPGSGTTLVVRIPASMTRESATAS